MNGRQYYDDDGNKVSLLTFIKRNPGWAASKISHCENIAVRVNELLAFKRTLECVSNVKEICPNCGKYMLIDGYVCCGCGYDPTVGE